VAGEVDSEVFLAITSTGSRGWIRRGESKAMLVAEPNEDGTWTDASSVLIRQDDPLYVAAQPERSFECDYKRVPVGQAAMPSGQAQAGRAPKSPPTHKGSPAFEAKMAVESDHAFWQIFFNTTAATNYALSLWGAVSSRYLGQMNTVVTIPYLALYTTPADPWVTPEMGGGTVDLLFELDDYWALSGFPNGAVLGHIISGDGLGGGVAYYSGTQGVGLFCDPVFGTAVSANMDGSTSIPVPLQDDFNWDFIVTAHETGHNWGTTHTHEICPTPLDQCSPFFGACQTAQVCQTGTIMSYCHLCPGGIFNSASQFHPVIAADLTTASLAAAGVCLGDYYIATAATRNGTGVNPAGFAQVTPAVIGTNWQTTVNLGLTGHGVSLVLLSTNGPTTLPLGAGELLIIPPFIKPASVAFGSHPIALPNDMSLLGVEVNTQGAGAVPGLQFYNAIDICIGQQ
jgi:hypothetical protein